MKEGEFSLVNLYLEIITTFDCENQIKKVERSDHRQARIRV